MSEKDNTHSKKHYPGQWQRTVGKPSSTPYRIGTRNCSSSSSSRVVKKVPQPKEGVAKKVSLPNTYSVERMSRDNESSERMIGEECEEDDDPEDDEDEEEEDGVLD